MESPDAARAFRAALADLTARASDLSNEGDDLSGEAFAQLLAGYETVEDAMRGLADLAFGYGNLALKLLVELERRVPNTREQILARLGQFAAGLDQEP